MNISFRFFRSLLGGCALGLAGLALSGCSDTSGGSNLLPMNDSAAPGAAKTGASTSIGSSRHGRTSKAPAKPHVSSKVAADGDLSAKELRAKKLNAKGQGGGD